VVASWNKFEVGAQRVVAPPLTREIIVAPRTLLFSTSGLLVIPPRISVVWRLAKGARMGQPMCNGFMIEASLEHCCYHQLELEVSAG
jgi:hypothetical protein